jgi:putative ABC transport system permease protein
MLGKIAWKNIVHKPLNSALCVSLLVFGVGIISLLLLIQNQLEQKFDRDLKNIDLVMGAKGSPLQLVLSAVYHLDAPTGNIPLKEARKFMNSPMVKEAIPLAYGDSYQGFRILGTTSDYIKKYDAQFREGRTFKNAMETTIGSNVAEKTGLQIGDTFLGTHGEVRQGDVHEAHPYSVVGILEKTNTVLDHLVMSTIESVWQVHASHDHEQEAIDTLHATELDINHDHEDDHDHSKSVMSADSMEITAVLMKYKTKMAALTTPRIINEQTNMQAVLPTMEINRLFYMVGLGATTLKMIAVGIMAMAGFSVFFVLYSRLRERKYELALMRSVGYRPGQLFGLLLLEGFLLAALGYVLGWLLSRVGIFIINHQAESDFNLQFDGAYIMEEGWLLLLTFLVGIVAALLPAWKAMRMDVSETLSEN